MAKKCYVGINGISKNVKKIYVGVDGVPKKVKKGYVGVNGVARLFWDAGNSGLNVAIKTSVRDVIINDVPSSASLELYSGKVLTLVNLALAENKFYDSNYTRINANNATYQIITNTPTKLSVLYTGRFIADGSEFYIYYSGYNYKWKVLTSFALRDTYSFVIDVEVIT